MSSNVLIRPRGRHDRGECGRADQAVSAAPPAAKPGGLDAGASALTRAFHVPQFGPSPLRAGEEADDAPPDLEPADVSRTCVGAVSEYVCAAGDQAVKVNPVAPREGGGDL